MRSQIIAIAMVFIAASAFGQRLVSIPFSDGTAKIQADVYGKGDRAIVLAHGGRFNKESWSEQAKMLADARFTVVAVQFRGDTHNPDGTPSAEGSAEDNAADVLAAVNYCHLMGAKTVSAIGGSLGGDAVADADVLAKPGTIDRMVILGSEGGAHPEKLNGRKLFLVAREDRSGSGLRLPGIKAAYAKAPQPKQLVVLKGSAHAQYLFQTSQGPSVMRRIIQFMTER